ANLKNIIQFADKFLYHDEDIPKSEFQSMLNSYHDAHSNNKVIQSRLVKSYEYGEYIKSIDSYRNELEKLFKEKDNELRLLDRSEEHTSELQSRFDLVCRLLLEKKKKKQKIEVR